MLYLSWACLALTSAMVYLAKSSSGSKSTTSFCDLLEVRLPDCEITRGGNLLASGERTNAASGGRKDSNGALDEAKEATETVDGRRAMRCSE